MRTLHDFRPSRIEAPGPHSRLGGGGAVGCGAEAGGGSGGAGEAISSGASMPTRATAIVDSGCHDVRRSLGRGVSADEMPR